LKLKNGKRKLEKKNQAGKKKESFALFFLSFKVPLRNNTIIEVIFNEK
jgi:hypothetical protein